MIFYFGPWAQIRICLNVRIYFCPTHLIKLGILKKIDGTTVCLCAKWLKTRGRTWSIIGIPEDDVIKAEFCSEVFISDNDDDTLKLNGSIIRLSLLRTMEFFLNGAELRSKIWGIWFTKAWNGLNLEIPCLAGAVVACWSLTQETVLFPIAWKTGTLFILI